MNESEESQHSFFLLMEEINLQTARQTVEWIFDCNFQEERPDQLNLIITSPGGELSAAFAIIDAMRGSAIPIRTIGLGEIASAGLMIFIAGEKGTRLLTPNTSILSHQYSWGAFGKEHELFATVKQFDLTTKKMINHYKKCSGLTEAKIKELLLPPQDMWLSAMEAKKLGLCDEVKELN
ncbi:ClpP Protease subunit of ATP-dependent Clp proteases [uncultured Caudovirales phage]|uniref:ClpP Protease subunit of ATP-dependent Clp proteases n=1 Tax=uncultured Caudovirales phage TaxID=2100421 RepID=A0A6J7WRW0_9CAUD|nr:ClpP Protease subunit of ATP-dependent Clp proteases [uncultured Caudovirales phage]